MQDGIVQNQLNVQQEIIYQRTKQHVQSVQKVTIVKVEYSLRAHQLTKE